MTTDSSKIVQACHQTIKVGDDIFLWLSSNNNFKIYDMTFSFDSQATSTIGDHTLADDE